MRIRFLQSLCPTVLILTALLPAALTQAQFGGPSPSQAVVTKDSAYLLLPPELIAAPTVKTALPSPNERLLLIERENLKLTPAVLRAAMADRKPPIGERSLVLWDSVARTSRDVWKDSTGTVTIQRMVWLPQTETALILVNQYLPPDPKDPTKRLQQRQGILRLTATMEKAQVVGLTELGETYSSLELHTSPNQPFALLQETTLKERNVPQPDGSKQPFEVQNNLYILNENGRLGARAALPNRVYVVQIRWTPEGSPLIQVMTPPTPGQKPEMKWYSMNTKAAELRPLEKQPDPGKDPENALKVETRIAAAGNSPLRVRMTKQSVKEGETTQSVGLLWLELTEKAEAGTGPAAGTPGNGKPNPSDKQRTLVSSDSTGGQLAARGEVILYQSQGAMWAAPLLKLTRAEYETAIAAAQRAVLLSNGKQIGLAALMYSQDYDETLPDGNDINSKLEPYLKNNSLFEGFTYTFGGGKLSSVEKPAETELGFIAGPGGRAVIYIDGHVKWKNGM